METGRDLAGKGDLPRRLGCGALPVVLALALLDAGLRIHAAFWPALALSVLVLWFGRRWMAGTLLTRALGISVAIAVLLLPALATLVVFAFGIGTLLALVVCLLVPVLLWDLFVWQPHKGRFARARAERRGLP
jgi:hypothetical protein